MSRIVAIHQPNLFPWLGYFNKIFRSDSFIILDQVQFPKKGGSWVNRVRLLINGNGSWITAPVDRNYHGYKMIREITFSSPEWAERTIKTIEANYSRSPFFKEIFPVMQDLILYPTNSLTDYNLNFITSLLGLLNVSHGELILGSALKAQGHATDLLISLVQEVGGNCYLCGGGAAGYQEDDMFLNAGLELRYQTFNHPIYPQRNSSSFVPGLSIIDVLMNIGIDQMRALCQNWRESRHE